MNNNNIFNAGKSNPTSGGLFGNTNNQQNNSKPNNSIFGKE